jgi:AcrR family transcriptional regulator
VTSTRTPEGDRPTARKRIQDVARQVFRERGFAGATIQEIALRTDLSVGAIYLHFKSKEELFVSLLDDAMEAFRGDLATVLERSDPPLMRLRAVWDLLTRLVEERPESHRIFPMLFAQGIQRWVSTTVLRELNRAAGRAFQLCAGVLEDGIRAGVFRPHDARAMADTIWALFVGTVQLHAARENLGLPTRPLEAVCAQTWDTLEAGLLAR